MEFYLKATGDTTDRSAEIMAMLEKFKVCILTPGTYYVSGIKMPEGTSLMGMGEGSRLVLNEDILSGSAVTLAAYCTVRDLSFIGCEEEMPRPTEVGDRHAICFVGDATTTSRTPQPRDCIIDGCRINSFTGGGITCCGTGYNINCSVSVTNCRIHNCGAGINISYFSEYHNFTNVTSTRNLYGCINNGGNNVFVGCGFDGNTIGYLIDNSEKQSKNNAHGTCTACTFNHTNFNEGVGIRILGSTPGYVFTGCQMFFSDIEVENSTGIQFANFNFGKNVNIRIKGDGVVRITDCIFSNQPNFELTEAPNVTVAGCQTKKAEPVEI